MLNKLELGKRICCELKNQEKYQHVKWDMIEDTQYENIAEGLMLNPTNYIDFLNFISSDTDNYEDETYSLIERLVNYEIFKEYVFDNDDNVFIKKKDMDDLQNILDSINISYKLITNGNNEGEYKIPVEKDDKTEYIYALINEHQYFIDYNHSMSYRFDFDNELIDFLSSCLNDKKENKTMELKYDTTFEVTELNGGDEYTVKLDPPLMVLTNDNKYMMFDNIDIRISNGKHTIIQAFKGYSNNLAYKEDIRRFIGIELSELLSNCAKAYDSYIKDLPKSYIKVKNGIYEVNCLEDLLKIKGLDDVHVSDIYYNLEGEERHLLMDIFENKDVYFGELTKDVNNAFMFCYNNKKLFKATMVTFDNCYKDINENKIIIAEDLQTLVEKYLKKKFNLPQAIIDNLDYEGYAINELRYGTFENYYILHL